MPQAVRLLCPWDRHVDAPSAWPHVNFSQPQSSAYYPGKLISTNHQIDEVRESAVPTEHVRTGAVPAGLWPLLAFTHRLRGGLIKFRPRRGLDACLFEDRFVPQPSTKSRGSKKSSSCSHTHGVAKTRRKRSSCSKSVAKTSKVPAAQRRKLNSPARKCRERSSKSSSPLQRTVPRYESTR
jgi:hypothetical protein